MWKFAPVRFVFPAATRLRCVFGFSSEFADSRHRLPSDSLHFARRALLVAELLFHSTRASLPNEKRVPLSARVFLQTSRLDSTRLESIRRRGRGETRREATKEKRRGGERCEVTRCPCYQLVHYARRARRFVPSHPPPSHSIARRVSPSSPAVILLCRIVVFEYCEPEA